MIDTAARLLLDRHGIGMNPRMLTLALDDCEAFVLEDGEHLCAEGGIAQEMWVLLEGLIEVRKRGIPGDGPLAIVRAPALLGHMGLVNGTQRSASCQAKGRCELLRMPATRFYALLAEQTGEAHVFRRLLIVGMNRQLELGNQKLQQVTGDMDLLEATVSLDGWTPEG